MALIKIEMGPEEAVDAMNAFFEIIEQVLGIKLSLVDGSLAMEVVEG